MEGEGVRHLRARTPSHMRRCRPIIRWCAASFPRRFPMPRFDARAAAASIAGGNCLPNTGRPAVDFALHRR